MKESPYPRRPPPSKLRVALAVLVVSAAVSLPWLLIFWVVGLISF